MATVAELLAWVGAPEPLLAWCSERAEGEIELIDANDASVAALLRSCPSAEWAPWIACVATVPMDLVLAAVGMTIEGSAALAGTPLGTALEEAYAAVAGEGTGEECLAAAKRCDAIATEPPRGFRSETAKWVVLAQATALVLRAAEAIVASMARDEAARMYRARMQTATLGGGMSAFVSRSNGPTVLAQRMGKTLEDEPPTAELVFAAAALGQALALIAGIEGDASVCATFVDAL